MELVFFFLINYKVFTLISKLFTKFLFKINLSNLLNLLLFKPINSAGNIPTSDKTEYLPPIKFLCSIISDFNFKANFLNNYFYFQLYIIYYLPEKIFSLTMVSNVFPDFDIIKLRLFFFSFLLFYFFVSRLSKK